MPVPDFESFKVAGGEVSSATKFNNLVQAVEDEFADIDQDQITGLTYAAFSPTWGSTGTQPALNNGILLGRYVQIGKFVNVRYRLSVGSTSTVGTGQYTLSLPVPARDEAANVLVAMGSGYVFDTSAGSLFTTTALWVSTTTVGCYVTAGAGGYPVGAAAPFAWATGDEMQLNVSYEAA